MSHRLRRRYGHGQSHHMTWDKHALETFDSWADVLTYAKGGGHLYYKAPMDIMPHQIRYVTKARTIRVFPPGSSGRGRMRTSDPFTADKGHLDRMFRPGSGVVI
jgi:hypothetical protein